MSEFQLEILRFLYFMWVGAVTIFKIMIIFWCILSLIEYSRKLLKDISK